MPANEPMSTGLIPSQVKGIFIFQILLLFSNIFFSPGKPLEPEGAPYYKTSTLEVTLGLLRSVGWDNLKGSHLYTDNFYTSLPLG